LTGNYFNVIDVFTSNITSFIIQGSDYFYFSLSFVPAVVYPNVDKQKESIVKENRNKSGVYQ